MAHNCNYESFVKPSQTLTGTYIRYLEGIDLATLTEEDLTTLLEYPDEEGDCISPLCAEATINVAQPINASPSGNWQDFNTIYNRWLIMSKNNNVFCKLLIGQEPNPDDFPNIP